MTALIEEFKREHSEIIATLNEVEEFSILSREGLVKLVSVKESLLEHLWNEDEQLYPVLRKASEHNKKLKEILDVFANDTENIYEDMLEFFDKYYGGVVSEDFPEENEKFFAAISKRIKDEENILYKEYEDLHQK